MDSLIKSMEQQSLELQNSFVDETFIQNVNHEINNTKIIDENIDQTITDSIPIVAFTDTDNEEKDNFDQIISTKILTNRTHSGGDGGSDSGVDTEVNITTTNGGNCSNINTTEFQRTISNGSNNTNDEPIVFIEVSGLPLNGCGSNISCNSSMISFCSDISDLKSASVANTIRRQNSIQDCTSEGGSESSSIIGGPICARKSSIIKKKVAVTEPNIIKTVRKDENGTMVAQTRSRAASASRALATKIGPPVLATKERARSRDKLLPSKPNATLTRSLSTKKPTKPNSFPADIKDSTIMPLSSSSITAPTPPPPIQRVQQQNRTPSRGRTPGTPIIEDGRWPSTSKSKSGHASNGGGGAGGGGSITPDSLVIKTKIGPISLETTKHSTLINSYGNGDKFATLPRRRREKSYEDLRSKNIRSNSTQRDRMTESLMRRQPTSKETSNDKFKQFQSPMKQSPIVSLLSASNRRITNKPKTKIYHEACVQTSLTSNDVDKAFAGILPCIKKIDDIEKCDKDSQVDIRDKEIERLHDEIRKITSDNSILQTKLSDRSQALQLTEQQLNRERDEKQAMTKELQSNTERILGMLALVQGSPISSTTNGILITEPSSTDDIDDSGEQNSDSLMMLESQIQQSEQALEEKQCEINKLHAFCKIIQNEMNRSLNVQKSLIEEKKEIEKETTELQDFLQDEKTALVDALRETEQDCELLQKSVQQKDVDIDRLQEECRHLVRISEQRRHEFLGMQTKYNAIESRSKELIAQQGSAVSGASMALGGLGSRLDQLVGQLVLTYSISEAELEEVVYHNEAYTNSGSEAESPESDGIAKSIISDGSLSPQRHQSFIVAVISAIKNAATSAKYTVGHSTNNNNNHRSGGGHLNTNKLAIGGGGGSMSKNNDEFDMTEMLDSETEPCLMMENVLEDVPMPDSHSHNMVSSTGMLVTQIDCPTTAATTAAAPATATMGASSISLDLCDITATNSLEPHHIPTVGTSSMINSIGGGGGSGVCEMNREEESLHNLSQAIFNRQKIELQTSLIMRNSMDQSTSNDLSVTEMPSISDYCCAQVLVDQIISVDNLVTKLLKVLRIIQIDNDNCIQQLICDKNKLQLNKEEMMEKMRDMDELMQKLKIDLTEASHELTTNKTELVNSKIELQMHRSEIDRLNVDICSLSTLCSSQNCGGSSGGDSRIINKKDILNVIKIWKENKCIPEPDLVAQIVTACQEIPILREKLLNTNCGLNDLANNQSKTNILTNLHDAIIETKRQYEAIDRALEILNNVRDLVHQYPELSSLQNHLEETNFQSAAIIPIYTALLASSVSSTQTTNISINQIGDDNNHTSENRLSNSSIQTSLDDCNANDPTSNNCNINNSGGTTTNGVQLIESTSSASPQQQPTSTNKSINSTA